MRGKPVHRQAEGGGRRSIPACAGEAGRYWASQSATPVYPRVCGGSGLTANTAYQFRGLSPRVRGKREESAAQTRRRGSIPACAGEARRTRLKTSLIKVYSRVCGGSPGEVALGHAIGGLSPRVRGKPAVRRRKRGQRRSIPACAGEATTHCTTPDSSTVYPRVCGGSSSGPVNPGAIGGLSPRVRGKRTARKRTRKARRSIPACAGEAQCWGKR